MTDKQIMEQIKDCIYRQGFSCGEGLVENFYLSLKSRPFALILGDSQTDMAKLPRLFAQAVGATEENGRYLQLAVRPDWMDSSDLFGWLNLEGKFIPGAIIDFMKAAQQDPDKPYFLCLDRLILSRAEYYLRDFLTAVESRRQPEGELPYVPLVYYGRDAEAIEKYGCIPVLNNLYVVGTINLDETSRPLNQRLLDRVHTITMTRDDIQGTPGGTVDAPDIDNRFLETVYFRLDQCREQETLLKTCMDVFEDLNKILLAATAYVGFKLRNDAILYVMHNRLTGVLSDTEAIDHEILQKVLTRVQGNAGVIRPVLEKLLAYCTDAGYRKSAQTLTQMLLQCETDGYASCWN